VGNEGGEDLPKKEGPESGQNAPTKMITSAGNDSLRGRFKSATETKKRVGGGGKGGDCSRGIEEGSKIKGEENAERAILNGRLRQLKKLGRE